jgi:alanine racemase
MIRSTVAHINLAALQANFRAIQQYLSSDPHTKTPATIAVVKANAYGHGSERVALALEQADATMLACADIEEGVVLRRAGVTVPILVFGALSVSDLDGLFEYTLTPTISTPSAARAVQAAAMRRGVAIGYHLKIDTGMNRLGFRHDNLRRTLPELLASPNLRLDAIYTHFATADDLTQPLFNDQRVRFEESLRVIDRLVQTAAAPNPVSRGRVLRHAANSAALLRDSRVWYDIVRPGLLLYGIVPPPLAATLPLEPVMSLTSRVVAVKDLRPGEGVGYGWQHLATSPSTIAVIPAGYADGLDMRLSGRGHVLIRGRRVPVIGAVSMDMLTVDVTGFDIAPGDEAVILGRQGDESWQQIDAREIAAAIGTVPWEVVCRIGARIERQYEQATGHRPQESGPSRPEA